MTIRQHLKAMYPSYTSISVTNVRFMAHPNIFRSHKPLGDLFHGGKIQFNGRTYQVLSYSPRYETRKFNVVYYLEPKSK